MSIPSPSIADLLPSVPTDALILLKAYLAEPQAPSHLLSDAEKVCGKPAREFFGEAVQEARATDLRDRVDWALHYRRQREPDFWIGLFNESALLLREHGVQPRAALHLGPGASRVMDVLAYASGIDHVASIDAVDATKEETGIYPRLIDVLDQEPDALIRLAGTPNDVHQRIHSAVRLGAAGVQIGTRFVHGDAGKLPFPDCEFDLVFSRATFEHFVEPQRVVDEVARTTAPGGWSLHLVDVKDHRWSPFDRSRPEKYLDFLAVPDEAWETRRGDAAYCNRWRAGDFRESFQSAGFEEVYFSVEERTGVLPSLRAKLLPRYRRRDDLDVLCFWLLCRKM